VESVESQKQASHSFHESLGNLAKRRARFPHSHSAGDEGDGKVENQKQVSHFPTAPRIIWRKQKSQGGRASPSARRRQQKTTKGDLSRQPERFHFQAHLALESNCCFRLTPYWNQLSISGSFVDWKMLMAPAKTAKGVRDKKCCPPFALFFNMSYNL
jgi:hypothetical protein